MPNESQKALAPSTRRIPYAPPPKSVQTLRGLLRLRNVLALCWAGGLSAGVLTLFLHQVPALKDFVGLPMVAASVSFGVGLYGVQFVDPLIKEYIGRRFRIDHIHPLTYWSNGVLSRGKSAYFLWTWTGSRVPERTELLQQLSYLTEDTAYLVFDRERRGLFKTLEGEDDELISAVLRAMPVLGDAHALLYIRHLAEGNGIAATNVKLRTEARSSLNRLQAILDLSSGSQTLLRAAAAPQAPEEHLLHPVRGNQETDPQELLRPDVQNEPLSKSNNVACQLPWQKQRWLRCLRPWRDRRGDQSSR
jgi:hypothetical protein